jgi:hypothetical protein
MTVNELPAPVEWPLVFRDGTTSRDARLADLLLGIVTLRGLLFSVSTKRHRHLPGVAKRKWQRISGGGTATCGVLWTRDGLVPESGRVELRSNSALMRRAFQTEAVDLSDFAVEEVLAEGVAPPQGEAYPGELWMRLSSPHGTWFVGADERILSLVGRCAGWHDPRLPAAH